MVKIIIILWQLPQHVLAWLLIKITKAQYKMKYKTAKVYVWKWQGGISLGNYIIVTEKYWLKLIKHEYGHSRQSLYFGWLYLIIIGMPSILQAGARTAGINIKCFPEQWADKLGGVDV